MPSRTATVLVHERNPAAQELIEQALRSLADALALIPSTPTLRVVGDPVPPVAKTPPTLVAPFSLGDLTDAVAHALAGDGAA